MNKTILGLDIGDSTIGVAASDLSGTICVPVGVIKRKSKAEDMDDLQKIIEERNVGTIVIGLPLDINGELGPQAKKVKKYTSNIRKATDCEIVFVDERFTSRMANNTLRTLNIKRGKEKGYEDALAASYILELYIKRNR